MIPIRNIYYMLTYAFQVLREQGYRNLETEPFEHVAELCAAILIRGVSIQLKRGLGREYLEQSEPLSAIRGRIALSESIKTRCILKRQLVCSYDVFSENSYMNRIIRTTMELLLRADMTKARKKELRKLLLYFGNVECLDIHTIHWNIRYNRNNQTYRMLISICYLVMKGLLQTNEDGVVCLMDFFDEQRMCRLYEKFILAYYRREFPGLAACAAQIPWALDDGMAEMLPVMQTDVMLSQGGRVLIIDAKYYSHTTQIRYDTRTLHAHNLYQIFSYVKNKDAQLALENKPHEVSGMLLYARTDEAIQPHRDYRMSGNRICVRTLDLNCRFSEIASQLNKIVQEYFELR